MKSSTRAIITMVILFALIAGLYTFSDWFSKITGFAPGEDDKIKLAQCLEAKGSVFFIEGNCVECEAQEEIFGREAYGFIPKIDCSKSAEICSELKTVPAWSINDRFYYGPREISELIGLSGCGIE